MSLCNVCRSIPFRKYLATRKAAALANEGFRFNAAGRTSSKFLDDTPWNVRRCTVPELVSRAKACRLCAIILLMVRNRQWVLKATHVYMDWEKVNTVIPRNIMVWMHFLPGSFHIYLGDPRGPKTNYLDLDLRKTYDSSLKGPLNRVVFRETLHSHTLHLMLYWLDTCNNSHPKCSHLSARVTKLPSRVLDVSSLPGREQMLGKHGMWREQFKDENCKLLQTSNSQTGFYAALSYCWGASLPLKTTTANLEAHKSAIGFDTLPRTLQDAILIVRWLNIEYVWIDCLCILQDSKADWEYEAARMADVYSNAYLTLAASRAEHCREGFLGPRKIDHPVYIKVEDDEGSFELYIHEHREPIFNKYNPLDNRAWATQESLLSRRVLHFCEDQMAWGCTENDETEERCASWPTVRGAKQIEMMAETLRQSRDDEFKSSDWANFIRHYSTREVTHETDTFPAISGVVQRIQQLTGDTYYAGLWKQHFLEGLLWYLSLNTSSPERVEANSRAPRRRQKWIAPSWSWASVKGEIWYQRVSTKTEVCSRLEECSVVCSGLDPFGALTAGFARIIGPVILITHVEVEDKYSPSKLLHCMIQLLEGRRIRVVAHFDFVHCLPCSVLMITPHEGLCIEKVEQTTNTYVQIGIVRTWGPDTLAISDHVSPRSIILV